MSRAALLLGLCAFAPWARGDALPIPADPCAGRREGDACKEQGPGTCRLLETKDVNALELFARADCRKVKGVAKCLHCVAAYLEGTPKERQDRARKLIDEGKLTEANKLLEVLSRAEPYDRGYPRNPALAEAWYALGKKAESSGELNGHHQIIYMNAADHDDHRFDAARVAAASNIANVSCTYLKKVVEGLRVQKAAPADWKAYEKKAISGAAFAAARNEAECAGLGKAFKAGRKAP